MPRGYAERAFERLARIPWLARGVGHLSQLERQRHQRFAALDGDEPLQGVGRRFPIFSASIELGQLDQRLFVAGLLPDELAQLLPRLVDLAGPEQDVDELEDGRLVTGNGQFVAYVGGQPAYRSICELVAEQGYAGFILTSGGRDVSAWSCWPGVPAAAGAPARGASVL